jgi:PAS domain S-box-containing protein
MDSRRPLILIVEDDPMTSELLTDLLVDAGYGVVRAADGREGLARILNGGVDLVLLDLMLPHLDGLQLCREVRSRQNASYLPILMLSSLSLPTDEQAGFLAGADDYIHKPFDAINLLNRVGVWVRTSLRLQQQQAALARQASLLDLAPDAIYVRDLAGCVSYWSAGAEVLYRWTREQAVDRNAHELLRTEAEQSLSEIETRVMLDGSWTGELVQTRRDGTRVRVASRWALECDENGRPLAILELNSDITEREALREAERRVVEARLEGVLLAGRELAYLLNNSLVVPVGNVDVLLRDPDLPGFCRGLVQEIAEGLSEVTEQIDRFQQVARVETRATPFGPALDLARSIR